MLDVYLSHRAFVESLSSDNGLSALLRGSYISIHAADQILLDKIEEEGSIEESLAQELGAVVIPGIELAEKVKLKGRKDKIKVRKGLASSLFVLGDVTPSMIQEIENKLGVICLSDSSIEFSIKNFTRIDKYYDRDEHGDWESVLANMKGLPLNTIIVNDHYLQQYKHDAAPNLQEIIRQLKEEGIFDMQRELRLPLFAQRVAVISAAGAAGYGDFIRQLQDNSYGFHFDVMLFPAVMQGEQVEQSVIAALNAVYECSLRASSSNAAPEGAGHPRGFSPDVVVILRGGGATADLSGFDTLPLAENVAQFPLPVITGIGHDRDESILDMVAHLRVKTPTAAAAYLIDRLRQVQDRIEKAGGRIQQYVAHRISYQQQRVSQIATLIPTLALRALSEQRHRVELLRSRVPVALERRLSEQRHRVELLRNRMPVALERRLTAQRNQLQQLALTLRGFDPQLLLSRGYSITLLNGKAVRDPMRLRPGDEIETRVEKGSFHSVVKKQA